MRDPLGTLRLRFAGLRPVRTGTRAEVYAGSDFSGRQVTVVVLTESASADPQLREAYRRAADAVGPDHAALDPYVERPWAAFHDERGDAVETLLAALGEPAAGSEGEPAASGERATTGAPEVATEAAAEAAGGTEPERAPAGPDDVRTGSGDTSSPGAEGVPTGPGDAPTGPDTRAGRADASAAAPSPTGAPTTAPPPVTAPTAPPPPPLASLPRPTYPRPRAATGGAGQSHPPEVNNVLLFLLIVGLVVVVCCCTGLLSRLP